MKLEDKDIIETIRNDRETGFRLLLRKYKEPVYWYIRRLVVVHEDAQDVAQETFLRIFKAFDSYHEEYSLKAWIYRIATNEALRLLENRKNEQLSLENLNSESLISLQADTYVNYSGLELKFQKAIKTLPEKQQITFTLRYYDELDYEEIARVIDSNSAAAKSNYHIAKNKIVQYMNSTD